MLKITTIRVPSVTLAHCCMTPNLLLALLLLGEHIDDKDNNTWAYRLHRDGMHPEMLKHIENVLKSQMLETALTPPPIQ